MILTTEETNLLKDFKDLTFDDWDSKIKYRGVSHKFPKDLDTLRAFYPQKIARIQEMLAEEKDKEQIQHLTAKIIRLKDKYSSVLKEMEFREKDLVERELHHTSYYIDYTNGKDTAPATGLKSADLTIDSTADTTHFVDAALTGADDYINGAFVWNVTRSLGAYVTDFVAATDTVTLGSAIAGMTAGDTYFYIDAWKTITNYTTTTVRTAGDIAYLRANTTWTQGTEAVDIIFDEDGSVDAYISIIGCDATTNDPWNDDSDVLPIIDFGDAAYQLYMNADDYWYFERLDVRQTADTNGLMMFSASNYNYIKTCTFRDGASTSVEGVKFSSGGDNTLDDCTFIDNFGTGVESGSGRNYIKNSTFNGGADVGTDFGIKAAGGVLYVENTTMGKTTAFDSHAIYNQVGGTLYLRNCDYDGALTVTQGAIMFEEDADQTFESHITTQVAGTITRDTGTARSGGADSSAKMESNVNCGPNSPLVLGDTMSGFAKVWATKDVAINISVYATPGSAWDSALSATEAYAKFSYLSNASTAARTEVNSTETIANNDAATGWTALTSGNITPLQTGFVYIWFYLAEYEDATEHVFVDIKPVVTTV